MGSNFMVKGKKIEWLAKRGWKTVAEIGAHSKLFGDLDSNQDTQIQSLRSCR